MREQDQQIALWKLMGFEGCLSDKCSYRKCFHMHKLDKCFFAESYSMPRLPDTNSLDVLHSMAQTLTDAQWWQLDEWLEKNDCLPAIRATPDKFRQGLMVTLNLWREDSNEEGK